MGIDCSSASAREVTDSGLDANDPSTLAVNTNLRILKLNLLTFERLLVHNHGPSAKEQADDLPSRQFPWQICLPNSGVAIFSHIFRIIFYKILSIIALKPLIVFKFKNQLSTKIRLV